MTNWMKYGVRTAALAMCALTVSAMPAMAQDNSAPPAAPQGQMGPGGPGGHHGPDPARMEARHLDMMTRHLSLTPEQVTQVKAIQDGERTQMIALRQDTAMPKEQKRAKMMAMRQESEASVRALLNDAQKPKYDEMLAMEKERMGGHREGGPHGAPPPPPPTL